VPFAGTDRDLNEWRERQARIGDDLAQLAHLHAVCLDAARAFVLKRPRAALPASLATRKAAGKGKGRMGVRSSALASLDAVAVPHERAA
jgi:hypothetical protein